MKKVQFAIILFTMVLLCACGVEQAFTNPPDLTATLIQEGAGSPNLESEAYWPTEGWRISAPEAQGMDSKMLALMFEHIDEEKMEIDGVVVIRNGYIVAEQYYPPYTADTRHVLYSCTKSFISALVGIAVGEGHIHSVDQTILKFFPDRTFKNVDTRKEAMTLENVLTMQTGLAWEEGMPAYQGLMASGDWVGYVLDKPMEADPGSQFNYCSGCSHLLSAIIQEATGTDTLDFAQSRLFDPLGITNFTWELAGNGIPNGGWGLEMTPRDMAKFGYLFLKQGLWDGQEIIPAGWVTASTQPGFEVEHGVDYAYQWWVYPFNNMFAAQGLYAQKIFVLPELEMVVVFTADARNTDPSFELLEDWIIPAVREPEA